MNTLESIYESVDIFKLNKRGDIDVSGILNHPDLGDLNI